MYIYSYPSSSQLDVAHYPYLSIRPSYLSIYPSMYLSSGLFHLPSPSIYLYRLYLLSIYPSLSIYQSIYLSIDTHLLIYLSIYLQTLGNLLFHVFCTPLFHASLRFPFMPSPFQNPSTLSQSTSLRYFSLSCLPLTSFSQAHERNLKTYRPWWTVQKNL